LQKIVIIPTYNEKENISSIVTAIFALEQHFHVLVIDDSSPDGTAKIVKDMQASFPNQLFIEERKGKQGLGTAYIYGFRWALTRGYSYIFEMDADFSHNPKDLDNLYEACLHGADVAVGSRYVKGGGNVNWPRNRIILSKGASFYTQLITRLPVKDPTAGFVCYKREVLEAINLNEIKFIGYAFQIEMKFASWKLGFVIKEVPIIFRDRTYGTSKMNKGIVKEGIAGVLYLRWQSWFKNYSNRVKKTESGSFSPVSNEIFAKTKQ
jgi:dolichol-phosphate mannosyltransferase